MKLFASLDVLVYVIYIILCYITNIILCYVILLTLINFLFSGVSLFILKKLSTTESAPESVAVAMVRMKYICTTYGLCGLMDCAANLIRALGHSMTPMLITLFGACGFRILWIFTVFRIPEYHSLDSIYVSYCFSWVVTYLILMSVYFFIFKKELKNSLK